MKWSRRLVNVAATYLAGLCAIATAWASDGAPSAFDLLFRSDVRLPVRTVLLTAREEGWRIEYRFTASSNGGKEIAICAESKPIILAAGADVALRVTSEDVIHTLSIPELDVTIDAIPGRLNERVVKPAKAGRLVAQATIEKAGKTTRKAMELTILDPTAYKSWIEKASQTQACTAE
ncbi:hypothetical protein [Labrys neptuniae]|uniref:Cytochrome oxidase subunit II copper A binding domain-containing protein n=1 Tax=Labrys neptuniae TaxID=376174 RepID=A0ABV3PEU1_9HYPH